MRLVQFDMVNFKDVKGASGVAVVSIPERCTNDPGFELQQMPLYYNNTYSRRYM